MAIATHTIDDEPTAHDRLVAELTERLLADQRFDRDDVEHAVHEALDHYQNARVREFVALLAERDARRRLGSMGTKARSET